MYRVKLTIWINAPFDNYEGAEEYDLGDFHYKKDAFEFVDKLKNKPVFNKYLKEWEDETGRAKYEARLYVEEYKDHHVLTIEEAYERLKTVAEWMRID